jgi:ABC-type sugar transport system ATPase subunit
MTGSNVLLEVKNVSKSFVGVKALDDVSLVLHEGEVLGLVGENGAGKSTLTKIILGEFTKDSGELFFKGQPYDPKSPLIALSTGLAVIHQEISLIPDMTAEENIWLGREEKFAQAGVISKRKRVRAAKELLSEWGININPNLRVAEMSVASCQLVELARCISYDADVIIMDEPTSALSEAEIINLYSVIRKLTAKGKGIIFISHKLDELFEICDSIVVLRDGQYVDTRRKESVTRDELISMMVGRSVSNLFPKAEVPIGETVFEVNNISRKGVYEDVSFYVRRGEILGFCGLMGAGRTEIMQSIFAIDKPPESGEIKIRGRKVSYKNTRRAISNGLSMLTEDRYRSGVIHRLSVQNNLSLAYLDKITRLGFVNMRQEVSDCRRMVEAFNIRIASLGQEIGLLSGGNQQKAILSKWLLTSPDVLILDEPTRGIDVGAKAEIYKLIGEFVRSGKAVIVISSELPEIMGISDRIMVVHEGRITAEVERSEFNQDRLMKYALGE